MGEIRDYQKTHADLLRVGRENFLEYGYEQTKLRKICRDAEVTTGAFYKHFSDKQALFDELVKPSIEELKAIYLKKRTDFFQNVKEQELTQLWITSDDELDEMIDFIYKNEQTFQLVFFKSQGSHFEDFTEMVTNFSAVNVRQWIKYLQSKQFVSNKIQLPDKELHFLMYSYYATVIDILKHRYPLEETKRLAKKLYQFVMPGWMAILEMNEKIY